MEYLKKNYKDFLALGLVAGFWAGVLFFIIIILTII